MLRCPHCEAELPFHPQAVGQRMICRKCRKPVRLLGPDLAEAIEPQPPPPAPPPAPPPPEAPAVDDHPPDPVGLVDLQPRSRFEGLTREEQRHEELLWSLGLIYGAVMLLAGPTLIGLGVGIGLAFFGLGWLIGIPLALYGLVAFLIGIQTAFRSRPH